MVSVDVFRHSVAVVGRNTWRLTPDKSINRLGSMNRAIALIEQMSWLLPLVLLFGLLVLMLATLQHVLVEIRLRTHAPYGRISALRNPGESTRQRIDRTGKEIAAFAVALGLIPIALFAALLSYVHFLHLDLSWMDTGYFCALSASFMVYGSNKIKRLRSRKRRLYRIYEGQMMVAQEIHPLVSDGYRVYYDFPTDRFHIDSIIVGPNGVFSVTTKVLPRSNRLGDKVLMLDSQRVLLGRMVDEQTLPFAAFQASWLAKWLLTATGEALTVHPVLTVPGWRMKTLRKPIVYSVEPSALVGLINRFPGPRLSQKTIRLVCEQVEAKCRTAHT